MMRSSRRSRANRSRSREHLMTWPSEAAQVSVSMLRGARSFSDVVEACVEFMWLARNAQRGPCEHSLDASYFHGAELVLEKHRQHLLDGSGRASHVDDLIDDVRLTDVTSLDVSSLQIANYGTVLNGSRLAIPRACDFWSLGRHRFATLKECRRFIDGPVYPAPYYILHRCAYLARDEKWVAISNALAYMGKHPNGLERWYDMSYRREASTEHARRIREALAIQFAREVEWRVQIGYEGCPRISFSTDATGAQEVIALRDVPEGRSRRAALIHWVTEHWRKKRAGGEVKVREHLRGTTKFAWNGLNCVILPARDDLARLQTARRASLERERALETSSIA
jgi:hypothetical protein